jgi:hypothetical protein
MRLVLVLLGCLALTGCGVAALPCRVGAAVVSVVPVVGHPAATPLNACASVIDP